jgi:hypothetical protein
VESQGLPGKPLPTFANARVDKSIGIIVECQIDRLTPTLPLSFSWIRALGD